MLVVAAFLVPGATAHGDATTIHATHQGLKNDGFGHEEVGSRKGSASFGLRRQIWLPPPDLVEGVVAAVVTWPYILVEVLHHALVLLGDLLVLLLKTIVRPSLAPCMLWEWTSHTQGPTHS
jgi:hypothetical protein